MFVPEKLAIGAVKIDRSLVLIENEYPHVTLFRKGWEAVASNYVLTALFEEGGYLIYMNSSPL